MKKFQIRVLFLTLNLFCLSASAQIPLKGFLKFGGGFISAEANPAFNVQFGIEPKVGNFMLSFNPLDVGLYPGDSNSRYRQETTSTGGTICRDTTNGQFSDSNKCALPIDSYFAVSGDLKYDFTSGQEELFLGIGYRYGRGSTPYGTLMFRPSDNRTSILYIDFYGGRKYFAVLLGIRYRGKP